MKVGLPKRSKRNSQGGHALLLAAMLGIFVFALWNVAYRATRDAEGMDASAPQRIARLEALPAGVARAGRLLRTGKPPNSPYKCIYRHFSGPGDSQLVTLEFRGQADQKRWQVIATLSTRGEARQLPDVPPNF
jgi:hypothetical protein